MKTFLRAAIAVVGLCVAPWTGAAEPVSKHYAAITYFSNSTEFVTDADATISADLDNLVLRYGYQLLPVLGIEGVYGFSSTEANEEEGESVENSSMFGVYVRGVLDLATANIKLIGRVGLASMKNEYSEEALSNGATTTTVYTTEATGVSYGIGAELFGTSTTALHVEWMKFLSTDDLKSDGWMVGFTHQFGMPNLW